MEENDDDNKKSTSDVDDLKTTTTERNTQDKEWDKDKDKDKDKDNPFHLATQNVPFRFDTENHIPKKKKKAFSSSSYSNTTLTSPSQPSTQSDQDNEVFTRDEVRQILEKAVKAAISDRDSALVREFVKILQTFLDEQYESFSRYSEDCLSRQHQDKGFSYLS